MAKGHYSGDGDFFSLGGPWQSWMEQGKEKRRWQGCSMALPKSPHSGGSEKLNSYLLPRLE